ncbi:MAG: DNA polymerase III subunit [Eubacteriales bacterium]|nr:DNA polymerase III subunit [Eubacteriales bacterium]
MLTFDTLRGNEALKQSLRRALAVRFPQSILLTGPVGIGKLTLARILSAALLCQSTSAPCGTCNICRRVEQSIHPDVTLVDLGDSEIKVDTARMIRSDCAVLPNESERRVFLIRHAQNMNIAAQNALLKILEEPPAYAFFILMTENASAILPTILSRCTQFALAPLSVSELTSLLRAQYPEQAPAEISAAAAASQGIAGNAAELLSGEIGLAAELAAPFLRALSTRDELEILRAANGCLSLTRRQFAHVLSALAISLRDAVFAAQALPGILLPATQEESRALAAHATVRELLAMYDWTQELLTRIDRNQSLPLLTGCLAARCYELLTDPTR